MAGRHPWGTGPWAQEVEVLQQQIKEARQRLTGIQETAALASMEERQAKGRASAGLAEVYCVRGELKDARAMIDFNLRLDISPRSAFRRKAKDVEKVLMVRKEGT